MRRASVVLQSVGLSASGIYFEGRSISAFDKLLWPSEGLAHPAMSINDPKWTFAALLLRLNLRIAYPENGKISYDDIRESGDASTRVHYNHRVCVPKTLSVLIGGGNHLTSAHSDRAAMFGP